MVGFRSRRMSAAKSLVAAHLSAFEGNAKSLVAAHLSAFEGKADTRPLQVSKVSRYATVS